MLKKSARFHDMSFHWC